jgi:Tfp pilus assembly protein PilV
MSLKENSGATLIEVLLAVVLTVLMVSAVAILIPKSATVLTMSRQKWMGSSFAATRIQQIMSQPYDFVQVTPVDLANFPKSGIAWTGGCDCSKEDMATYPVDSSTVQDGVTYTSRSCINLEEYDTVNSKWISHCQNNTDATDTGMKNVRVRVEWSLGNKAFSTETESVIRR